MELWLLPSFIFVCTFQASKIYIMKNQKQTVHVIIILKADSVTHGNWGRKLFLVQK